jgi:hypothetical protein
MFQAGAVGNGPGPNFGRTPAKNRPKIQFIFQSPNVSPSQLCTRASGRSAAGPEAAPQGRTQTPASGRRGAPAGEDCIVRCLCSHLLDRAFFCESGSKTYHSPDCPCLVVAGGSPAGEDLPGRGEGGRVPSGAASSSSWRFVRPYPKTMSAHRTRAVRTLLAWRSAVLPRRCAVGIVWVGPEPPVQGKTGGTSTH